VAFAAQEGCDGGGADEVDDGSGDAQGDVGVDVFSESAPPKLACDFSHTVAAGSSLTSNRLTPPATPRQSWTLP
jgi:hypothetical protein